MLRIYFAEKILFLLIIYLLVLMPVPVLADEIHCDSILREISSSYGKQQLLNRKNIRCNNHQVTIDFGLLNESVELTIDISKLEVRDGYLFHGLAGYYSSVKTMFLQYPGVDRGKESWIAVSGRFDSVLLNAPGAELKVEDDFIHFSWPANMPVSLNIVSGNKTEVASLNPDFDAIRYNHLWDWLASLAKMVEWSLIKIQKHVIGNWGWSVLLFAIFMKVLLLPIAVITVRAQRQVSQYKAVLEPQLLKIKEKFDGAEAHERIMGAHRALGITPFYTLKPLLASLIQIPVLVAVFNALGEMPQFDGESFLWIENLAYPDAIGELPFSLPMFGNKISLLPAIMTAVTILSAFFFRNPFANAVEVGRQKYGLYFMAITFFVLFYPFPAVMVLYWTFVNMLHIVQQWMIKI